MRRGREGDAKGIFQTEHGWRVWVRVDGRLYSKRFPTSATLTEMKAWREDQRVPGRHGKLPHQKQTDPPTPGTFAADADRYLKMVRGMPTYQDRVR